MWEKNLKKFLSSKHKIVANSLLSQRGEVVDDLADIAHIFNEHFSTVGERLVSNATSRGLVDGSLHLSRITSLEGKYTLPDMTGVCSEANIINVGREGNWSGWNQCKHVENGIEVHNNIFNTRIQSLDKVRALPKRLKIRVGHTYS